MSARYWTGPDDRHYAYNVDASYDCPVAKLIAFPSDADVLPQRLTDAAGALKMDPRRLAVMLRKSSCGARDRDGAKLTERCVAHGVKMNRRGYRAFVDEPVPEAEWGRDPHMRSQVAINRRLSDPDYVPRRVVEQAWLRTKREARLWAWERRQAAVEAAGATA